MSDPRLRRMSLGAILALALWLGAWGMERILARGRAEASLDPSPRAAAACEHELRSRLPVGQAIRVASEYRVQSAGDSGMRLVSRYERQGSAPTSFACDLRAHAGSWEVIAITVVNW